MIGKLYRFPHYCFLVFPSLEALRECGSTTTMGFDSTVRASRFWSGRLGCLVTVTHPEDVFLVVDYHPTMGYVKILGPNQQLGWVDLSRPDNWNLMREVKKEEAP